MRYIYALHNYMMNCAVYMSRYQIEYPQDECGSWIYDNVTEFNNNYNIEKVERL